MVGLLFHLGEWVLQSGRWMKTSIQMDVFCSLVTLKDHLLKSLCIYVLVSIIKSMTVSTSIALAGFRFPIT